MFPAAASLRSGDGHSKTSSERRFLTSAHVGAELQAGWFILHTVPLKVS